LIHDNKMFCKVSVLNEVVTIYKLTVPSGSFTVGLNRLARVVDDGGAQLSQPIKGLNISELFKILYRDYRGKFSWVPVDSEDDN